MTLLIVLSRSIKAIDFDLFLFNFYFTDNNGDNNGDEGNLEDLLNEEGVDNEDEDDPEFVVLNSGDSDLSDSDVSDNSFFGRV